MHDRVVVALALAALAGGLAVDASRVQGFTPMSPADPVLIDPFLHPGLAAATPIAAALAPVAAAMSVDVPILVYHVVRPSYGDDSAAVRAMALTPETFDEQMAYLRDAGYHIIGVGDLESYFASAAPLPEKPIILTFDDGWRDQIIYAFPILQEYGYRATFFVFTNAIGRPNFLTWGDLHALIAAGMTIGDHTRSHPYLTRITSPEKLADEIVGSRGVLEAHLGVPIHEFAYPFGQYNASTTALVEAAGYRSARGDAYTGPQSRAKLYQLSAQNAPVTLEAFKRRFP